ncbi:hypothetical protein BDZ94DRAFT_1236217 [Collybia nuda]|uniref:Uncharacterized protein n=1 Tax=Collybia nuda TaxID=64659 RepID=A0A9P5Y6V2_9AGAR|nr:hypothetical protein BDZ94DRAFT_1236217 [Collybia nuda]
MNPASDPRLLHLLLHSSFSTDLGYLLLWGFGGKRLKTTPNSSHHKPSKPIKLATSSIIGSANAVVGDTKTFQSVLGFGGSLSKLRIQADSATLTFNNLKVSTTDPRYHQLKNPTNYWKNFNYLFSPTDAAGAAGLNYLRVPFGRVEIFR